MAPLDNMSAVEEMLVQYADKQRVSITVITGKSGPAAGLNSKRYEEQISISDMGDDVVYYVDVQGVLFDSQQGAS
jgi:dihydroxyacetone kinase DhaKLM complex PTS-EIIA-like component DhaM